MKALYNGRLSDVWEISTTNVQPVWVQQAFKQNYLRWNDDKLVISMSGINPSMKFNLKISLFSYPGYASYPVGYIGDFLDITNHRVVSKKQFYKHYQIIEEDSL